MSLLFCVGRFGGGSVEEELLELRIPYESVGRTLTELMNGWRIGVRVRVTQASLRLCPCDVVMMHG